MNCQKIGNWNYLTLSPILDDIGHIDGDDDTPFWESDNPEPYEEE